MVYKLHPKIKLIYGRKLYHFSCSVHRFPDSWVHKIKRHHFSMKANICPMFPMAANLSCLTGSSFRFRWVLNSFVQPTHSGVPLLLLIRVMPYKKCFSGFALLCLCLESTPVIQHQLILADVLLNPVCASLFFYAVAGRMMSLRKRSSSNSAPVLSITKNTLIALHATAIFDCIPPSGFRSRFR